jgi:hypothetical protein
MSGMVAERARNPNPLRTKLGSKGFQVEQAQKEEEKRATNVQFSETVPGLKERERVSCLFYPQWVGN